jgi:hypothetical protein
MVLSSWFATQIAIRDGQVPDDSVKPLTVMTPAALAGVGASGTAKAAMAAIPAITALCMRAPALVVSARRRPVVARG